MSEVTTFKMGGGWGDAINWFFPEEFNETPHTPERRYTVVGWKSPRPKLGDLVVGEFKNHTITFEFFELDLKSDPPDMFFGKVGIVKTECHNENSE